MKIAIPTAEERLCMHFGHCEKFVIVDVNETEKKIIDQEAIIPPPHEPGLLPKWLHENEVNVIIAGGMGMRARQLFQQYGIEVITGAPPEHPQTLVLDWMQETLVTGGNTCDH